MKHILPELGPEAEIERIEISRTIEDIFSCFKDKEDAAFLNSSLKTDRGRFSFIGIAPIITIKSSSSENTVIRAGKKNITTRDDPFSVLEKIFKFYRIKNDTPFPFIGGGIGYFGYDLKDHLEKLPSNTHDDLCIPDIYFVIYRAIVIHDNTDPGTLYISVLDIKDKNYSSPQQVIKDIKAILKNTAHPSYPLFPVKNNTVLSSNFSKEDYIESIKKALNYIKDGDIYQVCLSQRFQAEWSHSPYDLYMRLNTINPAPFSAFLNYGDYQILSSSPELFLRISEGFAETRPMKGTRPRGKNPEEDTSLKQALEQSAKDAAELVMIVDLERNDLGRTAVPGSIKVVEERRLEPYPTVFQTISVIKSKIKDSCDMIDVLKNAFPGGSITGCPKIRAMEIIDELEPTKRGIYTGAIGYISFHETMNLNIAIRTMIMKSNNVYFQVGSGIVSDSDPETEYEETLHKARALIESLA